MKKTIPCILAFLAATNLFGQSIADSVRDFSGSQGSNGWYYGYYNVSADLVPGYDPTNDFTQFPTYGSSFGSTWWNISDSYWTSFSAPYMVPNGDGNNGGKTPAEHWVIQRWVSTVSALVDIHGHIAADQTGGGDGVIAMVFVNGTQMFNRTLGAGDTNGFDYSFGIGLRTNDLVDFVLSPGCCGDSTYDTTIFTALVDPADFVLSTAAAVEVDVPTIPGQQYQMQYSTTLQDWQPIGDPFTGTGGMVSNFFSIRQLGSQSFFRAQLIP